MKKIRISPNPQSRDDASHVLDDLYMIEDTLYQQAMSNACSNTHSQSQLSGFLGGMLNSTESSSAFTPQHQQQQSGQACLQTPNMQMQQAVAAVARAYNSAIFLFRIVPYLTITIRRI